MSDYFFSLEGAVIAGMFGLRDPSTSLNRFMPFPNDAYTAGWLRDIADEENQ